MTGLATEEAVFLENVITKVNELSNTFSERLRGMGDAPESVRQRVQEIGKQVTAEEFRLQILERQKELEKELVSLTGEKTDEITEQERSLRSQLVSLESYAQQLQQNVLSEEKTVSAEKARAQDLEKILDLTQRLDMLNRAMQAGPDPNALRQISRETPMTGQFGLSNLLIGAFDPTGMMLSSSIASRFAEANRMRDFDLPDRFGQSIEQYLGPYLAPLAGLLESIRNEAAGTKDSVREIDTTPRAQ